MTSRSGSAPEGGSSSTVFERLSANTPSAIAIESEKQETAISFQYRRAVRNAFVMAGPPELSHIVSRAPCEKQPLLSPILWRTVQTLSRPPRMDSFAGPFFAGTPLML